VRHQLLYWFYTAPFAIWNCWNCRPAKRTRVAGLTPLRKRFDRWRNWVEVLIWSRTLASSWSNLALTVPWKNS
jgi:hypothetical protein